MKHEEVAREVDSLSHKKGRRRGIGISKKMGIGIFAVMIAATLIASGALLSYYGKMEVTAVVDQSVVIREPGGTWVNFDTLITRDLGDSIVSCNDYTYKAWIWNRACTEASVEIIDECVLSPVWDSGWDYEGFDISHYIIGDTQTIELREKVVDFGTSPWVLAGTGASVGADVTFSTCGKAFKGGISYWGLTEGVEYSLIYYKDIDPRWGGDGVATVLVTFTPPELGGYLDGQVFFDCEQNTFPAEDDYNTGPDINYGTIEIGFTGDDYEHINGAKLWILPTSELSGSSVLWTGASSYLWETDLALYVDCDDTTPVWLPYVYPLFATSVLQPESVYCWITCYHVALNIYPGAYIFNTYLNPV